MSRRTIDGKCLAQMLRGGATVLSEHAEEVNGLNVFPVPDGDTGTNMTMTLEGGLSRIEDGDGAVREISERFAHGALLGARGNSGVILSQMLAGINEILSECETADADTLCLALEHGVKRAYAAVQKPTEGTILTVFRESTEYARANLTKNTTVEELFGLIIERAEDSLAHTKELLPVLAEADVVDSGGAGYLYFIIGMYYALTGQFKSEELKTTVKSAPVLNIDGFTRYSILEHGYCTELMLRLTVAKCDPDTFTVEGITGSLESMGGESIVAYKDGDLLKLHVHTFSPGDVLTEALKYGELLTVKIENMSLQHSEYEAAKGQKVKKPWSVVTVATGEGMSELFRTLGADVIVHGGQTCNPSAQDIIAAVKECEGDSIILLPNNKNVVLTAQQAAQLYTERPVRVVPTKSLMQGYGALSVLTPGITDTDVLCDNLQRAAQSLLTVEVTRAVRDAAIGGKRVCEGEYMALCDGELASVGVSAEDALLEAIGDLDVDDYELLTLFVGKEVDGERRCGITERLEEAFPELELTVYEGGQELYDYMLAVE